MPSECANLPTQDKITKGTQQHRYTPLRYSLTLFNDGNKHANVHRSYSYTCSMVERHLALAS